MKNIPFVDILFILISAGVLILITELGYSKFLSQFSLMIVIVAYLIGKYVGRIQLRKKVK
jgi:predicted aspartyl protease